MAVETGMRGVSPLRKLVQAKMNPGNRLDLLEPASPADPEIGFLVIDTIDCQPR